MKTLWKRSSSTRTSRAIRHGTLSRAFSTDAEHLASCDVQDCSWSTISAVKAGPVATAVRRPPVSHGVNLPSFQDEKGRGAEGETEEVRWSGMKVDSFRIILIHLLMFLFVIERFLQAPRPLPFFEKSMKNMVLYEQFRDL